MRVLPRLAVLFYVTMTIFLGVFFLVFVSHGLPRFPIHFSDVQTFLFVAFYDGKMRLIIGGVALAMLYLNFVFMKVISDEHQRERTIAFDNPTGRVSVSLSALEDLTRRVVSSEPDVDEARAHIRARNKMIDIAVRLVLSADVHIPDLTARLQEIVRRRVQDIIGVEETIVVRMHVAKISSPARKTKKIRDNEDLGDHSETVVPFQGYRA